MTAWLRRVHRASRSATLGRPFWRFGLLLLTLISASAYPVFFVYFHNVKEAVLEQVFAPLLIFAAIALAAWLIFRIISGTMAKGAFVALIFALFFMNYSLIEDGIRTIVPDWRWWTIAPISLFLLVNLALALRFFVRQPEGDVNLFKMTVSVGAAFLALTLFNTANGMHTLAKIGPLDSRAPAANSPRAEDFPAVNSPGRPNFYFFILDEYARQDVLKKYTGYDNTPFLKGLERKGFNVSYSSHSSSGSTRVSIGNYLYFSYRYSSFDQTKEGLGRPPLLELFKKAGYKTYVLTPSFQLGGDLVDVVLKSTEVIESLSLEKTILARSFIIYLRRGGNEAMRADRLNLLNQAAEIVKEPARHPKFLFFHILLPHEPFIFDENGGPVAYENKHNWANPSYYAGQLIFVSKKMDELTDIIVKEDPQAVVLMLSDHGARFFGNSSADERLASLNCLYVGRKDMTIEGLGPVNSLRLALNFTLGLRLDPLKD